MKTKYAVIVGGSLVAGLLMASSGCGTALEDVECADGETRCGLECKPTVVVKARGNVMALLTPSPTGAVDLGPVLIAAINPTRVDSFLSEEVGGVGNPVIGVAVAPSTADGGDGSWEMDMNVTCDGPTALYYVMVDDAPDSPVDAFAPTLHFLAGPGAPTTDVEPPGGAVFVALQTQAAAVNQSIGMCGYDRLPYWGAVMGVIVDAGGVPVAGAQMAAWAADPLIVDYPQMMAAGGGNGTATDGSGMFVVRAANPEKMQPYPPLINIHVVSPADYADRPSSLNPGSWNVEILPPSP